MVLRVLLISWDWLVACVEDARALLNARARRAQRRIRCLVAALNQERDDG